ncbi:MAG: YdcF family protein [Solobacterium sp.]|nr:YdcF family protein [Solobacterium sp.]
MNWKFNTRDTKPNLYNLLIVSIITIVMIVILAILKVNQYLHWISLILFIYFVIAFVLLLNALKGQVEYNPYSYNTIFYIGFLFFLIFLTLTFLYLVREHMDSIKEMSTILLNSANRFIVITSPFLIIFSIGLCISNIALIRYEGYRFVNALGILLSFMILVGLFIVYYLMKHPIDQTILWLELLRYLFSALYLYFECMLIGTIIADVFTAVYEPEKDKDAIIVLGCGMLSDGKPTPLLKKRVERAARFYKKQVKKTGKKPYLICSGGKGPDEIISEAECMKNELLREGIEEEQILLENQSTSTHENMLFSKRLIEEKGITGKIAFATTNFHVFRSGLQARRVKLRAVGMGSKTKWYFWPDASVREFVGLLTAHLGKQGFILFGIITIYTVLTVFHHYS